MSKIEVNTVDVACGSTLTLGSSGKTVTIASGASTSGMGRSGAVDWQTTPKTSTFTAVNGEGYFINSGSALTMNLPAGSSGAIVAVADYARNFATYNLTISPNGSEKIGGIAGDATANVNGQSLTFVYVDSTKGWVNVQNAEDTEQGSNYITATGGTITTVCTNYKVHTFTSPGTFCISAGTGADAKVDYLVIAGGGAGGSSGGGGGGAGGYRESKTSLVSGCWSASPLVSSTPLGPFTPGAIPITVGAGGAITPTPCSVGAAGSSGSVSTFSSITSAGGGGGGGRAPSIGPITNGGPGGSGGGGSWDIPGSNSASTGGTGNTPPVSPPQGQNGGYGRHNGPTHSVPGGGGGAGSVGSNEGSGGPAGYGTGNGGNGVTSSINGTPTARAGGGGGDTTYSGAGGTGGGGNRRVAGTANTGGGGGGGSDTAPTAAGAGGSGVVIIRYRFQ